MKGMVSAIFLTLMILWFIYQRPALGLVRLNILILVIHLGLSYGMMVRFNEGIILLSYQVVLFILTISTMTDLAELRVPAEYYMGVVPFIIMRGICLPDVLFSMRSLLDLVFILVLLLSGYVLRRVLGLGDVILLSVVTILIGHPVGMGLALSAMVLSSFYGLLLITTGKARKTKYLPLTPFILVSFSIYVMI